MQRFIVLFALLLRMGIVHGIEIRTASQDSAPKYFADADGSVVGLCVDIIRAIEKIDPSLKFSGVREVLPFRRIEMKLLSGQIDAFCGFSRTSEREFTHRFVDIPLYRVNYVMAVRQDEKVAPRNFDDIRALGAQGSIMGLFGTADIAYLNTQGGLIVDDSGKTVGAMLQRLVLGRGRFVYYHDFGLVHAIKAEGLQGKVRVLQHPFNPESAHYFVVSKKASTEQFIAIESALKKLRDNGALREIAMRYQTQ